MADTDLHGEYWRAVYDARNAAGWRARADELRREADICDAQARVIEQGGDHDGT